MNNGLNLQNMNERKKEQLIIFGATGDLASLKLFPAIYELYTQDQLPESFQLIGFGRTALSMEDFQKIFQKSVEAKFGAAAKGLDELLKKVFYFNGQYDSVESFQKLGKYCQEIAAGQSASAINDSLLEADLGGIERVAYFSVPPNVFGNIVENLAVTLKKSSSPLKIVIEKPFGVDEKSAEHLFMQISEHFEEENVYLLDHFLGKRPIQSILKLRMENNVINLMIKGPEIAGIRISAWEKGGVDKRIGYYDQVGAMKDMIQSHLLQILSLITMDIPVNSDIASLQREKNNILSAVRFSGKREEVLFAQFKGYSALEGVAKDSHTDTFTRLKLSIDRRDWFNVPIVIETGKRINQDKTVVDIEFKKMASQEEAVTNNRLVFEMKPDEKISLKLVQQRNNKNHGEKRVFENILLEQGLMCQTDFCLGDYSSLLNDIFRGEKIYFLSFPEIIAAWKVIDSVEKLRAKEKIMPIIYEEESDGKTIN